MGLKASDICKILEKCAMLGVSEFDSSYFKVKFHPKTVDVYGNLSPSAIMDSTKAQPTPDHPQAREGSSDRITMLDPQILDDMRKSQLLIDDPVGYETEMIDAHLREYFHNESVESSRPE